MKLIMKLIWIFVFAGALGASVFSLLVFAVGAPLWAGYLAAVIAGLSVGLSA